MLYIYIMKVTVRQTILKSGKVSLYLDVYSNGKRNRENLNLYLDGKNNKSILEIANQVRAKREYELSKPEIYSFHEKELKQKQDNMSMSFNDWWFGINKSDLKKPSLKHFTKKYGRLTFAELDVDKSISFREHLLNNLSQNSASLYWNKYRNVCKMAHGMGFTNVDVTASLKQIKTVDSKSKVIFSLSQLKHLNNSICPNGEIKKAAMFSSLTGLRFSDIANLTMSNITLIGQQHYLSFVQVKTSNHQMMPIPSSALDYLPKNLMYDAKLIKTWIKSVLGIDASFHSFRHTYATLQLQNGVDIYTISKMLGHKSVKTTEIYAKINQEQFLETTKVINL